MQGVIQMGEQVIDDIKCCVAKNEVKLQLKIPNTGSIADFETRYTLNDAEVLKKRADKYNIFNVIGQPLIIHFGENKVVHTNLNIVMMAIEEIYKASSKKHPLYDWERHVDEKIDNTVSCNLGAMFRHLYKIHQGEEIDPESHCPHWAHFACRWQMFVTSALRMTENGLYRIYDINKSSMLDSIYECITPEAIYVLGHITKASLTKRIHSMLEQTPDTRTRGMMSVLCQDGSSILNVLTNQTEFTTLNVLNKIFKLSEWVISYSLIAADPMVCEEIQNKEKSEKPWDKISVF